MKTGQSPSANCTPLLGPNLSYFTQPWKESWPVCEFDIVEERQKDLCGLDDFPENPLVDDVVLEEDLGLGEFLVPNPVEKAAEATRGDKLSTECCCVKKELGILRHDNGVHCTPTECKYKECSASRTLSSLWATCNNPEKAPSLPLAPLSIAQLVPFTSVPLSPPSCTSDSGASTTNTDCESIEYFTECSCSSGSNEDCTDVSGCSWSCDKHIYDSLPMGIEPHKVFHSFDQTMSGMDMAKNTVRVDDAVGINDFVPSQALIGQVVKLNKDATELEDEEDIDVVTVDSVQDMATALRASLTLHRMAQSLPTTTTTATTGHIEKLSESPSNEHIPSSTKRVKLTNDMPLQVDTTKAVNIRMAHNLFERKRRLDLRSAQDGLRAIVPVVARNPRASCITILIATVRYIAWLRTQREEAAIELLKIRSEGIALVKRVRELGGKADYPPLKVHLDSHYACFENNKQSYRTTRHIACRLGHNS